MHTFWIVLIASALVTVGLNWLTPVVIKYRLKGHGVDRPISTYRKRVKEQKERYTERINELDSDTAEVIVILFISSLITITGMAFIGWTWKPLLLLIFPYLIYQLPFILKNLFSKHIRTYMLIDEKALVVISEYAVLNQLDWKLGEKDIADFMNTFLVRTDYLKELDAFSDSAIEWVKLRETLESARFQDKRALSTEKKDEFMKTVKKHQNRYKELQHELHDVDKVWRYSIGVLEQPGVAFLNKEFEKKEMQTVSVSKEQVSPAIEELLKVANDPEAEDSLRKYAMDTVKEILIKTEAEKARYQSEHKKDDATSTILAARKLHNLPIDK